MEHIPFDAELHSPLRALGDGLNAVQADAMQSRLVLLLRGDKAALAGGDGGRIAGILAVDVKHVPRAGEGQVDGRIARTVWNALNALEKELTAAQQRLTVLRQQSGEDIEVPMEEQQ